MKLEFRRVLTNNEIKVLEALENNNHNEGNLYFHRINGRSINNLKKYLEKEKESPLIQIEEKESHSIINALEKIIQFRKKNIGIEELIESIENASKFDISERETGINLYVYNGICIVT